MHKLSYRQIHLDFHTSPHISGVGADFDKAQFQESLKNGHISSITCFGICHHGWAYYQTQHGNRHPYLEVDLLEQQYEAALEIGVHIPIYITAGISNWVASEHPEWRAIDFTGRYNGWQATPSQPGYHRLCFNTPYLDFLCEQISEIVKMFPKAKGIFLDIIQRHTCSCKWCVEEMRKDGLDPAKEEDLWKQSRKTLIKYHQKTTAAAKIQDSEMPVFHNSGHIYIGDREILPHYSHLELESLPTGGWGYDHFPLSAAYVRGLQNEGVELDFMGMTGKFHTTWGEFGGYKHPNALKYECAQMIAFGSKCSVGDQLHPRGEMDPSTYNIIGAGYKLVEEAEPWLDEAKVKDDFSILATENFSTGNPRTEDKTALNGTVRFLLENQLLFDIRDRYSKLDSNKILILAEHVKVDKEIQNNIQSHLNAGGKLILCGKNAWDDENHFLWPHYLPEGISSKGFFPYNPSYLLPKIPFRSDITNSPQVMYETPIKLQVSDNTKSLGEIIPSYFNREGDHFCSHQHTPWNLQGQRAQAGFVSEQILYFSYPVFSLYYGLGQVSLKQIVHKAMMSFVGEEITVKSNLPSQARLSLSQQDKHSRYVLHLLFANKMKRGGEMKFTDGTVNNRANGIEVIEELLPLNDTEVQLTTQKQIKTVVLQPQGKKINFTQNEDKVNFIVDKFTCHQMVEINY